MNPQSTLDPSWLIAPASWDMCQDSDQWQTIILQTTAEGSQETLPVQGIEVKWVEDPVLGVNFFYHAK